MARCGRIRPHGGRFQISTYYPRFGSALNYTSPRRKRVSVVMTSRFESQPTAGRAKTLAEQVGIWAAARLPNTEAIVIIPSAACFAHQPNDARGAIRVVRMQPVPENILHLVRQPEKDIGRPSGSGARRRLEYPLDFVVVNRRDYRREQDADRDTGVCELLHGPEACFRGRHARLHDALEVPLHGRNADCHRTQLAAGEFSEQVEVPRDQRAFGDDADGMRMLEEQFE